MGGGNKEKERQDRQREDFAQGEARNQSALARDLFNNYRELLPQAQSETGYERNRRELSEKIIGVAKSGDFTNLPPEMRAMMPNFADRGAQAARRERLRNTRGMGVSAHGAGANPMLLALNKEHEDGLREREQGEAYQSGVSDLVSNAFNEQASLQAAADGKKLGILGTAAGVATGTNNTSVAATQNWLGRRDQQKSPSWTDRLFSAGGAALGAL